MQDIPEPKKFKIICNRTKCVSTAFGTVALAFIYHFWVATNFVVFNIARIEILMAGMASATLCSLALDKVFTALPRLIHTTSYPYVKFKTLKTILNHVTAERKKVAARKNERSHRWFFIRRFFHFHIPRVDIFYMNYNLQNNFEFDKLSIFILTNIWCTLSRSMILFGCEKVWDFPARVCGSCIW